MWQKTWKYSEAAEVGLGLTAVGVILQLVSGKIEWDVLAFPVNLILVAVLLAALLLMHSLRHRVHLFSWLGGIPCAVVSICFAAGLTMIMGLVRQAVPYAEIPGVLGRSGLRQMLSAWYFVLPYTWMTVSLGMATLRVAASAWTSRTLPFILNHLGLFLVLVCGVAGSADMKRLSMIAYEGSPEWRAIDKTKPSGGVIELPIAIELNDFIMEVYPQTQSPKRFASDVTIYVKDSEETSHTVSGTIEVNHPFSVKGWKIYQTGYDERLGNESPYSIFELVRDPWLPAVYIGLVMMLAGAVSLFLTAPGRIRKKEESF